MSETERYIVKHRDGRYMCHDGQWRPACEGAIPDRVRVFLRGICELGTPYDRARQCALEHYPGGHVVRLVWKSKDTGADERGTCESCSKPANTTDFEGTPFCFKCALSITAEERDEAWAKGAALVSAVRALNLDLDAAPVAEAHALREAIAELESAVTR